jgi:hypothetical protein
MERMYTFGHAAVYVTVGLTGLVKARLPAVRGGIPAGDSRFVPAYHETMAAPCNVGMILASCEFMLTLATLVYCAFVSA